MRVIATAGHVDHGKSTLVRALTGINPDRLREEQRREMTIDLGFAWLTLPNDEVVSFVDVPGHIDFIENMLAGVGGVDAALLVVAADEGPMPQTLEHLDILNLLRVSAGLVALTKSDLAPDDEWIELISAEVRNALADTALAKAAIVPVSARTGRGLAELIQALEQVLSSAPPRRDLGRPRLPVDRAFTLPGFGTIVTGTLADGTFAVGDEVEVLTQRGEVLPARIRGLQTHRHKITCAQMGSRVAINLSGVEVSQVARGSVIARPGVLAPTTLVDVWLEMLATKGRRDSAHGEGISPRPRGLRHNAEVKIFAGAAHSLARVWLLEGDEIAPGNSGWAQLQLTTPMVLANGDRFIVRLPSPSITIGGGTVVDAHPRMRYRRRAGRADASVLTRLVTLSQGSPAERLLNALAEMKFGTLATLAAAAQLDRDAAERAVEKLSARETLIATRNVIGHRRAWCEAYRRAVDILAGYHTAQPLAEGMPRDTLRSQLALPAEIFNALLELAAAPAGQLLQACAEDSGTASDDRKLPAGLIDEAGLVRLASHQVKFDATQQRAIEALLERCAAQPWNTPSVKEARAAVGDAVYDALLRRRMLIQLSDDVFLLPHTFEQARQAVREFIRREGRITAAQARDLFSTTRKYALALLEYLDAIGFTRRVGDERVLRSSASRQDALQSGH